MTRAAINYDPESIDSHELNISKTPQKSEYENELIGWEKLMLEGLYRKKVHNFEIYGEDYLKAKIGWRTRDLNEFEYRSRVKEEVLNLKNKFNSHKIATYQFTTTANLEKYDFEMEKFPIRYSSNVELSVNSKLLHMSNKIVVNFINSDKIPSLKMTTSHANKFLSSRNNVRYIYVRYVFDITHMISTNNFDAVIKEVQFIDQEASGHGFLPSKNEIEKLSPFKVIAIN